MPHVNAGDTAWLLASAALVMFMTPGLAFFYGGLVRAKNVVGTVMQSFIALAVVTITWALIGYSLAFGPDKGGIIGGLNFFALNHVGGIPNAFAPTVPATTFMAFQMMFAIITPALIAGAFAERMKFSAYLMLIGLWSIFVYAPVAHWEWGGGFLGANGVGALDFAGGAVVHANAGAAALATAIYIGRRRGYGSDDMSPHNVPFVVLGAGILWFGWFGFNAGSALGANALASSAVVNTQLGAAAAVLAWIALERLLTGKVTVIGAATGAVAGLATITPAAGYVEPLAALAIGLAAGLVCFFHGQFSHSQDIRLSS
jgi:Amt family ammonium transporter